MLQSYHFFRVPLTVFSFQELAFPKLYFSSPPSVDSQCTHRFGINAFSDRWCIDEISKHTPVRDKFIVGKSLNWVIPLTWPGHSLSLGRWNRYNHRLSDYSRWRKLLRVTIHALMHSKALDDTAFIAVGSVGDLIYHEIRLYIQDWQAQNYRMFGPVDLVWPPVYRYMAAVACKQLFGATFELGAGVVIPLRYPKYFLKRIPVKYINYYYKIFKR